MTNLHRGGEVLTAESPLNVPWSAICLYTPRRWASVKLLTGRLGIQRWVTVRTMDGLARQGGRRREIGPPGTPSYVRWLINDHTSLARDARYMPTSLAVNVTFYQYLVYEYCFLWHILETNEITTTIILCKIQISNISKTQLSVTFKLMHMHAIFEADIYSKTSIGHP